MALVTAVGFAGIDAIREPHHPTILASVPAHRHVLVEVRLNDRFLDDELLRVFLDRLQPLHGKLGPVMFQFEYLNRAKMPSVNVFLDRLDTFFAQVPGGFQYAVEIRNPNWLAPAFFAFLTERKLGYVFLDGYFMPPVGEVWARWQPATADFAVLRLHGPDRAEIEKQTGSRWDRITAPKPEGLAVAAKIIRWNAQRRIRTYVNANNHYEGCAPLTIEGLLAELARER